MDASSGEARSVGFSFLRMRPLPPEIERVLWAEDPRRGQMEGVAAMTCAWSLSEPSSCLPPYPSVKTRVEKNRRRLSPPQAKDGRRSPIIQGCRPLAVSDLNE